MAQLTCERYEEALKVYKKMFCNKLRELKSERLCPNCHYVSECSKIKTVICKIDMEDIDRFFDDITDIYLKWIDTNLEEAIEELNQILINKNLLKVDEIKPRNLKNKIYYKGRIEQPDEVLTQWDMFHIPFNKRYLIGNQRYSLNGQPIMYVGSSILDIMYELNKADLSSLKVSYVKFDENIKLFDLRDDIWLDVQMLGMGDIEVSSINGNVVNAYEYTEASFYRNLLSFVCSFRKQSGINKYSFSEEYVLPQLLSQLVKKNGFDGIIYYSTKKFALLEDEDKNALGKYDISVKENVAVFTNYDSEHVYDRNLYDKTVISIPVCYNQIEAIDYDDIRSISVEIDRTRLQEKISEAAKLTSTLEDIFDKLELASERVKYTETEMGKLQLYLLYAALNQILISN